MADLAEEGPPLSVIHGAKLSFIKAAAGKAVTMVLASPSA